MENSIIIPVESIESRIYLIRGIQVMLDRDLAILYGVPVKVLNQNVKRNIERFPDNFCFQLTKAEFKNLDLKSQMMNSKNYGGIRYMPNAFTEQGVAMLSAVLRSDIAVSVSIKIMNAFVAMRKLISTNVGIIQRLETVELKQIETDKKIDRIFDALQSKELTPKCGIFYDGQVFDAYALANQIIKSAEKSIILIDNYIDESVLTILSKKSVDVKVLLLTKSITKQLELDVEKFNQQYPTIEIKILTICHDRFLIIDDKEIYHVGASLKDLGKKWFAFQKMESDAFGLIDKIRNMP
jgi:hypothetical protein